MVALVAAFTVARSSSAAAQIAINSAADIPVETTSGAAQAYYEAATGNVFFSLGTDLLTAVIFNVDDQLIVDNLPPSPADVAATPFPLFEPPLSSFPPPIVPPPLDSGIFFVGALLPADPSITDIASFQASPFGDATLLVGALNSSTDFNPFNVIAPTAAVPEPGSLSILALTGLGALARRRR